MGGRGASAGIFGSENVIAFPGGNSKKQSSSNLWDYRGEKERVSKLEKAVGETKGAKAQANLSLSLKRQDEHITKLIHQEQSNQNDVKGDINELITLRRRIRQAQVKLRKKKRYVMRKLAIRTHRNVCPFIMQNKYTIFNQT